MSTAYIYRVRQEIEVCSDCIHVSYSGAPTYDGYAESHHAERYAQGLELWGDEPHTDQEEPSFSWNSCDFCGDHLGGDRYTASVMQEKVGGLLP